MPRYNFKCSQCLCEVSVFVTMDEQITDCNSCGAIDTMVKLYGKFYSKTETKKEQKVGNITKEYIEKNKEVLKQQKKEARSKEYESS